MRDISNLKATEMPHARPHGLMARLVRHHRWAEGSDFIKDTVPSGARGSELVRGVGRWPRHIIITFVVFQEGHSDLVSGGVSLRRLVRCPGHWLPLAVVSRLGQAARKLVPSADAQRERHSQEYRSGRVAARCSHC